MVDTPHGERVKALATLYAGLEELRRRGLMLDRLGTASLRDCPKRGVYFFTESGEFRADEANRPRVVRVGTHGLRIGLKSTLGGRLSQHRGSLQNLGGNHRGSIFRLLVGLSLADEASAASCPAWGEKGKHISVEIRRAERGHECAVSRFLDGMSVILLPVPDEPGPDSLRGVIERNAIALLSNFRQEKIDPPSPSWLGLRCPRPRVVQSGLWNNNHVDEPWNPAFVDTFNRLVDAASP